MWYQLLLVIVAISVTDICSAHNIHGCHYKGKSYENFETFEISGKYGVCLYDGVRITPLKVQAELWLQQARLCLNVNIGSIGIRNLGIQNLGIGLLGIANLGIGNLGIGNLGIGNIGIGNLGLLCRQWRLQFKKNIDINI
ncbi:hypothetical protein Ahia01_000957500 [Argonauta hians]